MTQLETTFKAEGESVQYPLSRDEQAAMSRYLSTIRKQLQDVSDLFTARYGNNSNIAEIAVKALVSSTLLEHEMMLLESATEANACPSTAEAVYDRRGRGLLSEVTFGDTDNESFRNVSVGSAF